MRYRFSIAMLLAWRLEASTAQELADEYRVKAAFVFNFTKFVEWPAQAFRTSNEPICICVFGKNPFGDALGPAIQGKTGQERRLLVRFVSDPSQGLGCHELFVPAGEKKQLRLILKATAGHGVLTVSEMDSFVHEGGVVNF